MSDCDEAFALKAYVMRPYSRDMEKEQRDYNFHLSRARLIKNSFRIMVQRLGVLNSNLNVDPKNFQAIATACCVFHNVLILWE